MCLLCMVGSTLLAATAWGGSLLAAWRARSKRAAAMAAVEREDAAGAA